MSTKMNAVYSIIVHGGAWDIPESLHDEHLEGVERTVKLGRSQLREGATAIYAVKSAVKMMEDDPTFDAGHGSFLNGNGEVEMDAIIMDGSDLSFGAVAAIQNVKNPVEVADLLRLKTEHSFLVGRGAAEFAHKNNVSYFHTEKLLVGRELERYKLLKKNKNLKSRQFFESPPPHDTVGAVAMDRYGNIAVATSTGGTPNKLPGRVGDSPLIGSGAYADNASGGASSTGWGESLMKVVLAKTTLDFIARGQDVQLASQNAINLLSERVDGRGGVICLCPQGRAGYAYNTPFMARAVADQKGIVHVGIKSD